MRAGIPITNGEFKHMFTKCRPPTGWPSRIAVANSGGPDSTCLLFLVKRLLSQSVSGSGLPRSVVSLSIDHGLQASSVDMARNCQRVAESMGVQHITTGISWSHPPFPPIPAKGQAFENTARHARYHVLFDAMTRVGAQAIAFGHHADDQVETAIMRIAQGTTELGVGGMRRCRRWGMGPGHGAGTLGWAGYDGMSRWILRPLLDVGKDRLLATCEENRLDYVLDPTNFQPETTLRNAVRHMVSHRNDTLSIKEEDSASPLVVSILHGLGMALERCKKFNLDVTAGREALRTTVGKFTIRVDDIERQVGLALQDLALPAPTGTFLLSALNLQKITDDAVRRCLVLRILRYVSFHPWGSIRAEGGRRSKSIVNVLSKLWASNCWATSPTKFNSGGGVLWWPVYIQPSGAIVSLDELKAHHDASNFGWLASRMPPFSYARCYTPPRPDPLTVDVTSVLRADAQDARVSVLYDCRFLVHFDLAKMPERVAAEVRTGGEVVIEPHTRWFWPSVWLKHREEGESMSLATLDTQATPNWIEFEWVRTMD